jgi:hypothetical protein
MEYVLEAWTLFTSVKDARLDDKHIYSTFRGGFAREQRGSEIVPVDLI